MARPCTLPILMPPLALRFSPLLAVKEKLYTGQFAVARVNKQGGANEQV